MSTDLTPRPTTNPPVIDGVYTHADQVPARNPHRFSTRVSALLVMGATAGMLTHVDGTDLEKGGTTFALLTAIVIFLICLVRYNAAAGRGLR
jgi:hypothetical protein